MDVELGEKIAETNGTSIDPDVIFYQSRFKIAEVLIIIIALFAIAADGIILYIVAKYKSLHVRTNLYLCSLCFCNLIYMLFTPYTLNLFNSASYVTALMVCFVDELFFLFMAANYIFVSVLLFDWYVVTYKSLSCGARCRNNYQTILTVIWIFLVSMAICIITFCSIGIFWFPFIALLAIFSYFGLFCCICGIHVMKLLNRKITSVVEIKNYLELSYATSYCLCWLPNLIGMIMAIRGYMRGTLDDHLIILSFGIGYLHPIILLIQMYSKDKKFQSYFNKTFRKKEGDSISIGNVVIEDEHRTTLV